jgi:hypothetical protein
LLQWLQKIADKKVGGELFESFKANAKNNRTLEALSQLQLGCSLRTK